MRVAFGDPEKVASGNDSTVTPLAPPARCVAKSVRSARILNDGTPRAYVTVLAPPNLSLRPWSTLTGAKGVMWALPPPLTTAGWALGPITAIVRTLCTSRGRRFASFLSSTALSSAPWRATSLPAWLYREIARSGAWPSSHPRRLASVSSRRTLSSMTDSLTVPLWTAGASVWAFMKRPLGISRSSPAFAAATPSYVADQSDM